MFLPFVPMFVGMHVLVATAGTVPRIDIEKTCRTSEKTIKEVFGKMMTDPRTDLTKPCIEWYQSDTEMTCMMKLK